MPFARTNQPELLDTDAAHVGQGTLAGNLRDIRRANRWFGGTRAVLDALQPAWAACPPDAPLTILDLATGSADIPVAIVQQARQVGRSVRVLATDLQPSVLAVARTTELPEEVELALADARALPYSD